MTLLTALTSMMMMAALGAGLALTTTTESLIAVNHRDGLQTLYAAESGIELAISRLRMTPDWTAVATPPGGTPLVTARLDEVAQSTNIDSRFTMTVAVSPDPTGDRDMLVLQSVATGPGGNRRIVEVTVRRLAADATGVRAVEPVSWR